MNVDQRWRALRLFITYKAFDAVTISYTIMYYYDSCTRRFNLQHACDAVDDKKSRGRAFVTLPVHAFIQ